MANEDFELKNKPSEVVEEISTEDFKFVQSDSKSHEQKFQTKPTTFFKDSVKRFAKNKSSVVATIVLGALLLLAVIVPIVGKFDTSGVHDTTSAHPEIRYLEPKLFDSGTGFWDGTKKCIDVPVDISSDPTGLDKQANWWPDETSFVKDAITNKVFKDESYTNKATPFGKGGYVKLGYYENIKDQYDYVYMASKELASINIATNYYLTDFTVYDENALASSDEKTKDYPERYSSAATALYFVYSKNSKTEEIKIVDYATSHSISESTKVNISDVIRSSGTSDTVFEKCYFEIRVENINKNNEETKNCCALIKSIKFVADIDTETGTEADKKAKLIEKSVFEAPSFEDGNSCMIRAKADNGYWSDYQPATKVAYLCRAYLCSFTYDTYEAVFGKVYKERFDKIYINEYIKNGWLKFKAYPQYDDLGALKRDENGKVLVDPETYVCEILNPDKCPILEPIDINHVYLDTYFGDLEKVDCYVLNHRFKYGLDEMPKFILGTDKTGRDMFIYVFEGLGTSLLLGVATTVICFLFGLFWGSVSGYFGGTVDLVMERFTDILSGIPWIVVMTLVIINMGSNFFTFALALCLTGWIGTAATTRTQFYRFRGREYVLASRTLGASHGRLIAKHILPNAMGTIITSAVLMVPSVIFSEATISYLGLGFKNLASLGVILSDNQAELTNYPYLLIFPSIVIALLMISFNLFGNGLRDAVNPSLKGEGE